MIDGGLRCGARGEKAGFGLFQQRRQVAARDQVTDSQAGERHAGRTVTPPHRGRAVEAWMRPPVAQLGIKETALEGQPIGDRFLQVLVPSAREEASKSETDSRGSMGEAARRRPTRRWTTKPKAGLDGRSERPTAACRRGWLNPTDRRRQADGGSLDPG